MELLELEKQKRKALKKQQESQAAPAAEEKSRGHLELLRLPPEAAVAKKPRLLWRVLRCLGALALALFKEPRMVRLVGPGQRPLERHEFERQAIRQQWHV
jgi:hypothetical protein